MALPAPHWLTRLPSWAAETLPSSCPSTRDGRSTTPWEVARGPHVGHGISFHSLLRASLIGRDGGEQSVGQAVECALV